MGEWRAKPNEDSEEGFMVVENPSSSGGFLDKWLHSSFIGENVRGRNNNFIMSERKWVTVSRNSVNINLASEKQNMLSVVTGISMVVRPPSPMKEEEYIKSL
ncbi:hypothetical protein Ancab_028448 [Ancistrocladus abbreviatus]